MTLARNAALGASLAVVIFGATIAVAKPDKQEREKPNVSRTAGFWHWVRAPRDAEIQDALSAALRVRVKYYRHANYRVQAAREVVGILRYAMRLAPQNETVMEQLAEAAEVSGDLLLAETTYRRYLRQIEKSGDKAAKLWQKLGRTQMQMRRYPAAGRSLLRALTLAPKRHSKSRAKLVVQLAAVHMAMGRVTAAVRLLRAEVSPRSNTNYAAIRFVLAVAYDRNEEFARSAAILRPLVSTQGNMASGLRDIAEILRDQSLTPIEDLVYYRAFYLELCENLPAARREWSRYLRLPKVAFARRALAHIRDIDKELGARGRAGRAGGKRGRR